MFGGCSESSPSRGRAGFLQKNNSLEERSRIGGSLKERSAKDLLSCDNQDRETRFRRTETDFSNLYARGRNQEHTAHCGLLTPMLDVGGFNRKQKE